MNENKKVVIISGPSGSGKNSILQGVLNRCENCIRLVTATTRDPREGERNGEDHYFLTKEEFLKGLDEGVIPEHWHALDTDRYYGTYLPDVEQKIKLGKIIVAEMQIEGMRFFKQEYDALTIFVTAGSLEELEKRIRKRQAQISEAELQERLNEARKEIHTYASQYDYVVKNEHGKLEVAIEEVLDIMRKEQYL